MATAKDSALLESVLITDSLKQRASRAPDYQAETNALLDLARVLATPGSNVLEKLVEGAQNLCRAHSAGISLLEYAAAPGYPTSAGDQFRWHAVAGQWAPLVWNTLTQRDDSPCGIVVDRNMTQLFSHADRYYPQFSGVYPPPVEALLAPFHVDGRPAGTLWVVSHNDCRRFDAADQHMLETLAIFAATAYQVHLSMISHQQANALLTAEIAERERAQEALRQADHRKNEFLALLAHELRNPLAPIRNAVEILRRSNGETKSVKLASEMMQRQLGQMVHLVDDLLDVSRISRGTIELQLERLELASAVNDAVDVVRPACDSFNHVLSVTMGPEPIYLEADPTRLRQIVTNLLNNACKFTEPGGRIDVAVERVADQAVIRVRDSGIGIADEQLARIFDLFAQVDTSLERARDGLGIGLALVRTMVEKHRGTIEAHSEGLGRGSEFVVRLPAVPQTLPPPSAEPLILRVVSLSRRRVLVVDDNEDAAVSLSILLRSAGHEVHIAYDGLEALDTATRVHPDVILLDVGLPKLDGYETARRIRQEQRDSKVTLVALTGWGQEEDRQRSRDAGFDVHLVKPVDLDALARVLADG